MVMSPRTTLLAVALFAAAAIAVAQQPGQRPERDPAAPPRARTEQPQRSQQAQLPAQAEKFLVQCLINANQGEIALARIAQQQAQSEEVKEFAAMMIKDHSQFVSQLEQLTGASERGGRGAEGARQPPRNEGTAPNEGTQGNQGTQFSQNQGNQDELAPGQSDRQRPPARTRRAGGAAAQGSPIQTLIEIDSEIAQRCLASARQALESKEGAEFDKAYIGMQVFSHMKMADQLAVLRNHATGEFKQVVSQGHETTQQHLAHAKKLMNTLKGEGTATARRPRETPETE